MRPEFYVRRWASLRVLVVEDMLRQALARLAGDCVMSDEHSSTTSGAFPATAWNLLRAAQNPDDPARTDHRNQFLARYQKPVFVFLRARRYAPPHAEELTQEFFLHFLEGDLLRRADPQRGRFRNYLLAILVRFLADQAPNRLRRQTAFEQRALSLDLLMTDAERSCEPPAGEPPETLFMRQWAVDLVAEVRARLKELCVKKGRGSWYDIFGAAYPPTLDAEVPTQEELARRLGVTRDQVRYALTQTEGWFRVLLRAEVRDQVSSDEEVGEEVRELLLLLRR